jgi:hypothetical protein
VAASPPLAGAAAAQKGSADGKEDSQAGQENAAGHRDMVNALKTLLKKVSKQRNR